MLGYARDYLQRTLTTLIALPDEMQKTIRKLRSGELEIRSPDALAGSEKVARAVRKLAFAVLSIGMAFFSLKLWEMGLQEEAKYGWGGSGVLLVAALWK